MATARCAPSVTAFDEYLYLRVADIPVHLLPFAYDSSGSGLPVRDECASARTIGSGSSALRITARTLGCAARGIIARAAATTPLTRGLSRESIESVVVRSILAGATPADVSALVQGRCAQRRGRG